jgi:CheY-like chemotaxis protein
MTLAGCAIQPFRRLAGHRPSRWIFLSLLVLATALRLPAQSAPTLAPVTVQFETPQNLDPFEHAKMVEMAQENTERHRMRIAIPQAAFSGRPDFAFAGSRYHHVHQDLSADSPAAVVTSFALKVLCVFLGAYLWVAFTRKHAPELLQSMTALVPAAVQTHIVPGERLVTLLAEEKAVLDFQTALSVGAGALEPGEEESASTAAEEIINTAFSHIREIRRWIEEAGRKTEPAEQRNCLLEALNQVRFLKNTATPAGLLALRQVTTAVEMLVTQLTEKAGNVTSSTLRTVTIAIGVLQELCKPGLKPGLLSEPPLRLLVVDDEMFSRFALCNALKRGLSEPDVAETGETALKLAERRTYDLILLDIQMPGMDGFELCSRIHETYANLDTPVVFVTSLRDFDARANSVVCGGRDLIAKPFLTFELTVKSLTLVATERLAGRGRLAQTSVNDAQGANFTPLLPEIAHEPDPDAVPMPAALEIPVAEPEAAPVDEFDTTISTPEPAPAFEPRRVPMVPSMSIDAEGPSAFFAHARTQVEVLRELVGLIQESPDQIVRQEMVAELFLGVHLLMDSAEMSSQPSVALIASAMEGLLKKFLENTSHLTSATIEAVATASDLLLELCTAEASPDLATNPPIRTLVVDDDPISLRAMSSALQMRFEKPDSASDGKSGLALATEKLFDVIFLDVQMPGLDGFEVCTRIRESTVNSRTPVVFVTNHESGAFRAKSELCGGNDFLTKPCFSSELNVKALAFALRARLQFISAELEACPA